MNTEADAPATSRIKWGIALAVISVFCLTAFSAAFVVAAQLFLILFLAMLFGVFLSKISGWIADRTPLNYAWSLAALTTTLVLLMAAGAALFGVKVNAQVEKAQQHLDEGVQKIQDLANRYPLVESTMRSTPIVKRLLDADAQEAESAKPSISPQNQSQADEGDASSRPPGKPTTAASSPGQTPLKSVAQRAAATIADIFQTTFGLVANSLLIFFTGLFIAISPGMYRDGVVRLFPPHRRSRTREIMNHMGDVLWSWLIGRFGTMLVTGVGAGLLLAVLGVPMAASLGIATALLTFIPNIGGIVALLLSVLFAAPLGVNAVVMVVVGYMLLQLLESYGITPLIQQHQAAIPPALLLAVQAIMVVLFGFLGAAVASPLLAAAKKFIEDAYIQDVLEANTPSGTANESQS